MSDEELRLVLRSEMDVSLSVLEADRFARAAGFAETPARLLATAVSELAHNILKHGGGRGEVRLRRVEGRARRGIEVEARDRGPGIADVEQALTDHFSSAGTLGLGLPGVKRMMDEFEIESTVGRGTLVRILKWR